MSPCDIKRQTFPSAPYVMAGMVPPGAVLVAAMWPVVMSTFFTIV